MWNIQAGRDQKKKYVEFPGVLVLGFKISEGCNTIMWSF